jgi:hypothetical protein
VVDAVYGGEINRTIANAGAVDFTDGLGIEFSTWRFNLRSFNTDP